MLKKLKSLFVIEQDDKGRDVKAKISSESSPKKTTKKQGSDSRPTAQASGSPVKTEVRPGQVREKFLNVLFGAMERNDLEGFDYLEFKQFLKSLNKVQMDEGTKFQSAFATAQTMGASIGVLKKSANHYLQILKEEEDKFNIAANNQKEKNLVNKQEEIKLLQQHIEEKTKRIQTLEKEIANHKKLVNARTREIDTARVKVQQTKNDFEASYQTLVSQIQSDIKKIDTYLSQPKK